MHTTTKGFGQTINDGVAKATDNMYYLNTDVTFIVQDLRTVHLFEKPKTFAVSYAQKDQENNIWRKQRFV